MTEYISAVENIENSVYGSYEPHSRLVTLKPLNAFLGTNSMASATLFDSVCAARSTHFFYNILCVLSLTYFLSKPAYSTVTNVI